MSHTRGSTITIRSSFVDIDGEPTIPDSATMHLKYTDHNGASATEELEMENDESVWSVDWDSSPARKGTVFCSVRAVGSDGGFIVRDDSFELTANPANVVVV